MPETKRVRPGSRERTLTRREVSDLTSCTVSSMGFLGRDRPGSQMDGTGPECNGLSTPRKLPF